MRPVIRAMGPQDWPDVAEIYAQSMGEGGATFETECPTFAEWDASHFPSPRLVAEHEGRVIGWAALSPVSSRPVYRGVGEVSLYIAVVARRQGLGRALLLAMEREAANAGFWTLQSGIFRENEASIALHAGCGFRMVGYRERIGQDAAGRWLDTVLMEIRM